MSDLEITLKVPADLVERALAVGVNIDQQSDQLIALLEAQIRQREAAQRLDEIGKQLRSLPVEMKPTPEEIEREIKAYWAERGL
jgi:hypothetical protein